MTNSQTEKRWTNTNSEAPIYVCVYIYMCVCICASGLVSGPYFGIYELISGPGRVNKRPVPSETTCFVVRNWVLQFAI